MVNKSIMIIILFGIIIKSDFLIFKAIIFLLLNKRIYWINLITDLFPYFVNSINYI